MAAQIFFLDTNVFLECKALEELPWKQITDQDPVRLIVPLTTIEEIDKRKKGNDKKAERARRASQRLRLIRDAVDKKTSIRNSGPNVSLEIAPLDFPKEADFPNLAFDAAGQQNYRRGEAFLVRDAARGFERSHRRHNCTAYRRSSWRLCKRQSPPNGFCQGDRTKKDKKIREQEEKIKFLSTLSRPHRSVFSRRRERK